MKGQAKIIFSLSFSWFTSATVQFVCVDLNKNGRKATRLGQLGRSCLYFITGFLPFLLCLCHQTCVANAPFTWCFRTTKREGVERGQLVKESRKLLGSREMPKIKL